MVAIPEARFRVTLDQTPTGETVSIELYSVEGQEEDMGLVEGLESVEEKLMDYHEGRDRTDDDARSVKEILTGDYEDRDETHENRGKTDEDEDEDEYEFRFEIEGEKRREFEDIFTEAVLEGNPQFEPIEDAFFYITIYDIGEGGMDGSYRARYTRDEVPIELTNAFSDLHRTAYENVISSFQDDEA